MDGYGQDSITVAYTGTDLATRIEFYQDGVNTDIVCEFNNVNPGDEFTCKISDYNNGEYPDFETDTYFTIYSSAYTNGECVGSFHTSCSRDIVLTLSEGCTDLLCMYNI